MSPLLARMHDKPQREAIDLFLDRARNRVDRTSKFSIDLALAKEVYRDFPVCLNQRGRPMFRLNPLQLCK